MTAPAPHPRRFLLAAGLLAVALGVLLGVLSLPAAAYHAPAGDAATARAVRALTDGPGRDVVVPPGFEDVLGYRPRREGGSVGRPDGSCSSPVPLPARFDPLCRRHDLGYDLLRYAAAAGAPLGPWARVAIDRQLLRGMRAVCAGRRSCELAAEATNVAVRANSRRQGDGPPLRETPASAGAVALGGLGAQALLVLVAGRVRSVAGRRARRSRRSPGPRTRHARRSGAPSLAHRLPLPAVSVLSGLAVAASLAPSVLPRPWWVQGLLTGLLVTAALGLGRLPHLVPRLRAPSPAVRVTAVGVALGTVVAAAGWLRLAGLHGLETPQVGGAVVAWPAAGVVAAAVVVVAVLLGRGARRAGRALGADAGGTEPVTAAGGSGPEQPRGLRTGAVHRGTLVLLAVLLVLGQPAPQLARAVLTSPAGAWFFETVGLQTAADNTLNAPPTRGAVRVYVGVEEGGDAPGRAELAVRRLERRGGFAKGALVLALPTGSGWVDPVGVRAVERRFHGDVATVAVQPTFLPSWAALMVAREDNEDGARALVDAVAARLERLPAGRRPDLYLIGQSLGVLSAAAVDPASAAARLVCGATWAGPPGGEVPALPGSVVLANRDDPVVRWEPELAWHRPADWTAPVWLPGVTWLATGLDTLTSLGAPRGHGHRYGAEQGTRLPACGDRAPRFDMARRSLTR